jgi:hypothetical protein
MPPDPTRFPDASESTYSSLVMARPPVVVTFHEYPVVGFSASDMVRLSPGCARTVVPLLTRSNAFAGAIAVVATGVPAIIPGVAGPAATVCVGVAAVVFPVFVHPATAAATIINRIPAKSTVVSCFTFNTL